MNMKYLGRDTDKFYCKKCFMKEFNMTKEQGEEQFDYKSYMANAK